MSKLAKALTAAAGNAGGDNLYVEDVFSTYLYTGTGSAMSITNGVNLEDNGGIVWTKPRTSSGESHRLIDAENSTILASDATNGKLNGSLSVPQYYLTNEADGFNLVGNVSVGSGVDYASWTFRKAEKFFDVVTYTGDGVAGRTVAHNLGSVPAFMIVKRTDASGDWWVYHSSLGGTKYMRLNFAQTAGTATNVWNNTAPTDSVFSVGNGNTNLNGAAYVAYLFASDAGGFGDDGDESIIKCGSFAHNFSGATVDCGFEPQWILVKAADQANNWYIFDVMRGIVTGGSSGDGDAALFPNTSGAENVNTWGIDVNATGFTVYGNNILSSGNAIYMAIRRPMKTPESGTEVFNADYQGNGTVDPAFVSGFVTDFSIKYYTLGGSSAYPITGSRLTGTNRLTTSSTAAQVSQSSLTWDYMNGWYDPDDANSSVFSHMFKRATGFMDVVAYTGDGVAGSTQAHNLGVAPECMIVKRRDGASSWITYWDALGATKGQFLDTNQAFTSSSYWNDTAPTATQLTLGSGSTNNSSATFIAYLFATLDGVSKVGSYTGTGSNVDVDCGFSAGARFILIKRTDSSGDWYVWDSVRGIVAGNDPYLLLNSTAAEVTSTDYIDPLSSGFTVTSSAPAALNASGGTYIFLAIA